MTARLCGLLPGAGIDLDQLDDSALGEFVVELSRQRDRLDVLCGRAFREHDRRQPWRAAGACSETLWLAERLRIARGQAGARALACDGSVTRVLTTGASQPIDDGRWTLQPPPLRQ